MQSGIFEHIRKMVPEVAGIYKANLIDDKNGTDYWIQRQNGLPPLSIDMKNRDFCPIKRHGSDDACIEITSIYNGPNRKPYDDRFRIKIGWTLDTKKQTDYVIYTWPTESGKRRFWILPFPFLCEASLRNYKEWVKLYGEKAALQSPGKNYITLSTYPTRSDIKKAMQTLMYGII